MLWEIRVTLFLRFLTADAARLPTAFGAERRIFDPRGLPPRRCGQGRLHQRIGAARSGWVVRGLGLVLARAPRYVFQIRLIG